MKSELIELSTMRAGDPAVLAEVRHGKRLHGNSPLEHLSSKPELILHPHVPFLLPSPSLFPS